ncbi:hypothetical protein AGABI2DRAFT_214405 [Agaricus bisporus var. bisporus H97]|uniref:hypothetical protein n=1 Tax=Agaricus bisporus var. bisporus (strain H97 / ATCC MYA-4626 / FGSC 10389) TaxID=936046 RepID=UPI00029F6366|nr:hypothetical protein AGABI2DRAFT_214405 [Agaricus bisporus var. bisporus H97]EKV51419.1 hypothetical protein AGABI2DRAFT_214405 [Agaricus bisporus var. bisporus H97]
MPKSAKKRKDKAADFAKAKLKLGKEKRAPSNVIDTSFKARSIALPTQSIAAVKDETAPTTKRKLTINDLLTHLKHYNPSVKRDALAGLNELLEAHWSLINKNLSLLINQLARLINDEDASVRKQLLAFFTWLLPRIPQEDLIPHASALVLFTASAQTHIFPEIRIDAVRFLGLFLDFIPVPLVQGWDSTDSTNGKRILEGYLGNLSAGIKYGDGDASSSTVATSSGVILSPTSKLAVLQSFLSFLRTGLSIGKRERIRQDSHNALHAWYMSQFFTTQNAFRAFEEALRPRLEQPSRADLSTSGDYSQTYSLYDYETLWTMQELENTLQSSGGFKRENSGDSTLSFLLRLSRTLHPVLVSTFLDCASAVFTPDGKESDTETMMVLAVSRLVSLLYGTILSENEDVPSSTLSELENFLGYMTPYFPFSPSNSRDIKIIESFQDLNIIYCELTSLLVLHSNSISLNRATNGSSTQAQQSKSSEAMKLRVRLVSEYITKLLRGQSGHVSQSLSGASYLALLPSIWSIVNNSNAELSLSASDVLQATLEHAKKSPSKSSAKRLAIEFVARLVLLDTESQFRGSFRAGGSDRMGQRFDNWLIHLPQVLWEIGGSDPMATEVIFRFLLRLLQRQPSFIVAETISALSARLVPYFAVTHSVRGQRSGPYSQLSTFHKHLCLDMVSTLLAYVNQSEPDTQRVCPLVGAVQLAVADTGEQSYWTHVWRDI